MTMRLSEAIRLGAMLKPQGFGKFWLDGKSCAMGAAMNAIGLTGNALHAMRVWPWLDATVQCPACFRVKLSHLISTGRVGGCLYAITHLNDDHRWTREAIADWVETIEPHTSPLTESVPLGTVTNVTEPTHSPQEATR